MLFIPLRDENPSYGVPYVVLLIIAINVWAFFMEFRAPGGIEAAVYAWGAIPRELVTYTDLPPHIPYPVPVTLLTSMFMHGGLMHLAGNMWFLWLFGDNCEWVMGRARFIAFYVICGLAAAGAQIVLSPMSTVPLVGASGAIAGVLGAYLLYYPGARVLCLFWFVIFFRYVYIPSWLFLGVWILFQIWMGLGGSAGGGGVAYAAHIGGFFTGLILAAVFRLKKEIPRADNYRATFG